MECLICKRTGLKLFNINLCFGNDQNTIKGDIVEFLGNSIENHLENHHCVCNICMNMLDDIVKSKITVLNAILGEDAPEMGRFWNFIYQDTCDVITPSLTPNTPPMRSSRDVTPIFFVSKTKAYNESLEKKVERREGVRSELRRDRRKSAVMKKIGREIVRSAQSDEIPGRSPSVASDLSFLSCTDEEETEQQRQQKNNKLPVLIYGDDDEIIYPLKRTRSVSRSHERNVEEREKIRIFQCEECPDINLRGSLALYTSHMIEVHFRQPYYKCDACGNEFLTRDHMTMHVKNHDIYPIACAICRLEQPNVSSYQSHIDEHLSASFKCFICDMAFVSKKECNKHIFSNHRRRGGAGARIESKILQKIDYQKPNAPNVSAANQPPEPYRKVVMLNVADNTKPIETFKGLTFTELQYLRNKRATQPDEECPAAVNVQQLSSLGDDMVVNKDLEESLKLMPRTLATPSSIFKDDGSVYDFGSTTSSPSSWKRRRRMSVESGRSTPHSGRSYLLSDDDSESDLPPNPSTAWSTASSRDLESVEIENIFANDATDTESIRDLGNRSISVAGTEGNDNSDVESEMQYFDGENFVPSINNIVEEGNS